MAPKPKRKLPPGVAAATLKHQPAHHGPPVLVQVLLVMHMVFLFSIVLAMTMKTLSLDDIKKTMYFIMGPALFFVSLLAYMLKQTPPLPKPMRWGLGAFMVVVVASTLHSAYHWVGWQETLLLYSSIGFMLSASIIASHRRTSEPFIRFLVVQLLVTNLIGIFLYDFYENDPATGSMVSWLYNQLYGGTQLDVGQPFQTLLYTFVQSDGAMQSTILNRDFYSGFLILYIPFAMLLMLDPGPTRRPILWRIVGGAATILSIVCVIKAQSKGEYIVGSITFVLFLIFFFNIAAGHLPHLKKSGFAALVGGVILLVSSILLIMSPMLMEKLKTLKTSVSAREIIWAGSVQVFKHNPILGGGPGTFRIYNTRYQAPDYYLHEIANVTPESHNYFLDLLAEEGLLGFGAYMFMAGSAGLMGLMRLFRKRLPGRLRVKLLAALLGMFAIYGSNFSSPNGRWVIGASSLWTALGFLMGLVIQARLLEQSDRSEEDMEAALDPQKEDGASPPPWELYWRQWRTPIMAAALVGAAIMPFYGAVQGIAYFNSRVYHLDGYRMMQGGYSLVDGPGANTEQAQAILEGSVGEFEEAIAEDPFNNQAYYQEASVLTTLSNIEGAKLQNLTGQLGANKTQIAQQAALQNERLRLAKDRYEQLNAFWTDYAEINYNLCQIYKNIAMVMINQENMGIAPGSPELASGFQEHTALEWTQLALDFCERQHRFSNKETVSVLLGQTYVQLGLLKNDLSQAVNYYRQMIHKYPDDSGEFRAYHQKMVEEASKVRPDQEPAQLLGAFESFFREAHDAGQRAGDARLQCEALDRLCIISPLDDNLTNALLETALANNLHDVLVKALDRLEQQNPLDPRIAQYRLAMMERADKPDAVLAQLERYIKTGGRDEQQIANARAVAEKHGLLDRFNAIVPAAKTSTGS